MIRQVQVKGLPQPVYVPVCIPDLDDVRRLAEELHRTGVK